VFRQRFTKREACKNHTLPNLKGASNG